MILIVGAGFLGNYIIENPGAYKTEAIVATYTNREHINENNNAEYLKVDVTDYSDMQKLKDYIGGQRLKVIYLAACHNIDFVFENPDIAENVNINALEKFLQLFKDNIEKLLFASTDCVYGENSEGKPCFDEGALCNPVNEYGRQKLRAEKLIISQGYTVVRLPYMLGPSLSKRRHFYDIFVESLKKGENIEMIDGLTRSVLSYCKVAELLIRLLQEKADLPAVINIASDRAYTKYEMGLCIAEKSGAQSNQVIKISQSEGEKFFKDKRASAAVMNNALLKSILGIKKINWEV